MDTLVLTRADVARHLEALTLMAQLREVSVVPRQMYFDTVYTRIPLPTESGNLIVKLPGQGALENAPRRLFMTHMDTVPLCAGAKPRLDGKRIVNAVNTALGGDNRTGCAVLVTLAAELLKKRPDHAPVMLLFTVREESGLYGARNLDQGELAGVEMGFNFDGRSASEIVVGAVGADRWGPVPEVDLAKHSEIALEGARQGIVLLKNDGALPLPTDEPLKIAVIGGYAQQGVISGTGSGAVAPVGGFAGVIKIGGAGVMGRHRNLFLFPPSPLEELQKALPQAQFDFDPGYTPAEAALTAGRDHDWASAVADAKARGRKAGCVSVKATDPLYILYTSGTTGQPKGVVRDNGGHMVALKWTMKNHYGVDPGETYWAASRSQSVLRSVTSVCRNGIAMPASLKASRMAIRRSVLVLPALLRS